MKLIEKFIIASCVNVSSNHNAMPAMLRIEADRKRKPTKTYELA